MFANKTLKIWLLFLGLSKSLLHFQVLSFQFIIVHCAETRLEGTV